MSGLFSYSDGRASTTAEPATKTPATAIPATAIPGDVVAAAKKEKLKTEQRVGVGSTIQSTDLKDY